MKRNYKKMGKRILSMVLVFSLVLGLLPQKSFAKSVETAVQENIQDEVTTQEETTGQGETVNQTEDTFQQEESTQKKDDNSKDVLADYGMIAWEKGISLSCSEAYFMGNIFTGKDFNASALKTEIQGSLEAVGNIAYSCNEFVAEEELTGCDPVELPDIRSGIESKSDK